MAPGSTNAKISWTDLPEEVRNSLFRVWTDARDLLWAERCWSYLDKHGLTSYGDEVSKVRVLVRLMSLAEIYREFCDRAWEEPYECELAAWAVELDLNRFRLAQCVGSTFEEVTSDDEETLYETALVSLAEETRHEIHQVLIEEFGGEANLFVSLWNTVEFQTEDWVCNDDEDRFDQPAQAMPREQTEINWLEGAEAILADVTADKMSAYEWIDQGMPRER